LNTLYYGDNLDVMRRYVADESVDLIYLDPPFKSNQDYNILFAEQDGSRSASQIKAFEDTWCWDQAASAAYEEVAEQGGRVSQAMQAFRTFLGDSDMLAYLAMMAPRLVELRRVLKETGSIYLHCDPTASHYLKMLMDAIFGPENLRGEIIWKRTNARSTANWPRLHDTLLFYSKGDAFAFRPLKAPADKAKLPHTLITKDGLKYQTYELTAPGVTKDGDSGKPWRRFDPTRMGRHWGNSRELMDEWDRQGLIHWAKDGFPRRRDEILFDPDGRTVTVGDVWTDIDRINQAAKERLGYPTQKPEALLDRILAASSDEGDTVFDPFCGCGTTVAVAQRLGRKWIGRDITHLAITLIRHRLFAAYGGKAEYEVIGEPVSLPDAEALAAEDKYQFQWWALGLVGARPADQKKGADKGIDGRVYFHDEPSGKTKQIILSVKGGELKADDVRALLGVIDRERAEIGVLITLNDATRGMRADAASSGFYKLPVGQGGQQYPRLQILTVAELLAGQRIKYPSVGYVNVTYKKAPRAEPTPPEQLKIHEAEAMPRLAKAPRRRGVVAGSRRRKAS
jgi:DNA modification methylase